MGSHGVKKILRKGQLLSIPRLTTCFLGSLRRNAAVFWVDQVPSALPYSALRCSHRDFVRSMVMMRVMLLSLVLVAAVRPNHQHLHATEHKSVKKHHERASATGCCSVYDESEGKLTGYCKRGDLEDGCVSFNTETVKHMTVDEEFCEKKAPFTEIPNCWFMPEG